MRAAEAGTKAGEAADGAARRSDLWLFLTFAALYLATWPVNHAISIDPYFYARMITAEPMSAVPHPRLMLWILAMQALYRSAAAIMPGIDPFTIIGAVNALVTALAVALMARVLRTGLGLPTATARLGAVLFGLSYGVWRYATEIEVYALAMCAALGLVLMALANDRAAQGSGGAPVLALAVAAGLLGLFYQPLAILTMLAVPGLLMWRGRLRALVVYCAIAGLLTLGGFALGAVFGNHDRATATVDFVLQTRELRPTMPGLRTIVAALYGFGSDILSTTWMLAHEALRAAFLRLSPGEIFDEEIFAAGRAGWLAFVPALTLPAAAVGLGGLAVRAARWGGGCPPAGARGQGAPIALILLWFLAHAAMMTILSPSGFEGWLLAAVPFWMIVARWLLAPALAAGGAVWGWLLVAAFLLHNGLAGVAIQHGPSGDYFRARTDAVLAETGPGDLIVIATNWNLHQYLRHRARAETLRADEVGAEATRAAIAAALGRGARVVMLDDMEHPPAALRFEAPDTADALAALAAEVLPGARRLATGDVGWAYELAP